MRIVVLFLFIIGSLNGFIIAQEELPTFEEIPPAVKSLLNNSGDSPFGEKHKMAPEEIEHIGKLAGIWFCDTFIYNQGKWINGTSAYWTFKYILDGFAIQDLWFKKLEDLPKQAQSLGHDFSGINIRTYDPYEDKWTALWLTNAIKSDTTNNLVNTYDGVSTDTTFIMTRADLKGKNRVKITFHNMKEDSFDWKREVSSDSGKTWNDSFRIEGRRIK